MNRPNPLAETFTFSPDQSFSSNNSLVALYVVKGLKDLFGGLKTGKEVLDAVEQCPTEGVSGWSLAEFRADCVDYAQRVSGNTGAAIDNLYASFFGEIVPELQPLSSIRLWDMRVWLYEAVSSGSVLRFRSSADGLLRIPRVLWSQTPLASVLKPGATLPKIILKFDEVLQGFQGGAYESIREGWVGEGESYRFAHIDPSAKGQIRFIDSIENLAKLRWTTMKVGRYLTKYHTYMSPEVVRDHASTFVMDYELKFTKDPDEIERIYVTGPSSCMSKPAAYYLGHCHPVRVYGNSPDIALAYVMRGKKISARCLVWPDKKRYGRVYGDENRMEKALKEVWGTASSSDLEGARIAKIADEKRDDRWIMPYIDGYQTVEDAGDWWKMNCGNIGAGYTEGVTRMVSMVYAEDLSKHIPEDDAIWSEYDDCWYSEDGAVYSSIVESYVGNYTEVVVGYDQYGRNQPYSIWGYLPNDLVASRTYECGYSGNTIMNDVESVETVEYGRVPRILAEYRDLTLVGEEDNDTEETETLAA